MTNIEERIPHRPPMLLLDEVVERSAEEIHCRKTFSADEFFFQGHYPNNPIVPGVILCEAAMQAGAVLLSEHAASEEGVPVATRMNQVQFRRIVRPGETIDIHVVLEDAAGGAFRLKARVLCEGSLSARLEFACMMAS